MVWTSVCLSVHLSVVRTYVLLLFLDENLSKHQWIFTKLAMCIDIVEIWFGIAIVQIWSLKEVSARYSLMVGYYSLTFLL